MASLSVRTPAERRATPQPAAVRRVLPFRLQQGVSTQHRTLQPERETLGLCPAVCPVAELEAGAPLPVRGARASLAAGLKEPGARLQQLLSEARGVPKFKKKGQCESFRVPQGFEVDNGNGRIKLPKMGWMRYRKSQEVLGEAKNVTIRESCGKWFIAVQTEREVETPLHESTSMVGLDWGIVRFYTLSDGEYQEQCQPLKKCLPKLAKLQRRMARRKKFSSNWKKVKASIAKLHHRIANIRKDFLQQSSNDISKNHAVVFVEDLQVRNMSKSSKGRKDQPGKQVAQKSGLNRAILDGSPFELRRQLEYKTEWRGGRLYPVPPQNTSRTCPVSLGGCGLVSADNRKTQAKS